MNEDNYDEEVIEDMEESKKLEDQQIEDKIFSSVGLLVFYLIIIRINH